MGNMRKNLVKIGPVVFEISQQTLISGLQGAVLMEAVGSRAPQSEVCPSHCPQVKLLVSVTVHLG